MFQAKDIIALGRGGPSVINFLIFSKKCHSPMRVSRRIFSVAIYAAPNMRKYVFYERVGYQVLKNAGFTNSGLWHLSKKKI